MAGRRLPGMNPSCDKYNFFIFKVIWSFSFFEEMRTKPLLFFLTLFFLRAEGEQMNGSTLGTSYHDLIPEIDIFGDFDFFMNLLQHILALLIGEGIAIGEGY